MQGLNAQAALACYNQREFQKFHGVACRLESSFVVPELFLRGFSAKTTVTSLRPVDAFFLEPPCPPRTFLKYQMVISIIT